MVQLRHPENRVERVGEERVAKRTISAQGRWWGPAQGDRPGHPHHEVVVEIGYEDETFYIKGLRDGHSLSLQLEDIARAIADCPE
jgi:hypothetical protein